MPDDTNTLTPQQQHSHPDIALPGGKKLVPRARFADDIGVTDRTVKRMHPPTTYIGNVAYVDLDATLKLIADDVKRSNVPAKGRKR